MRSTFETVPLAGRTALVTGASRGIGAAVAVALAAAGAEVVLTSRDDPALLEVETQIRQAGRVGERLTWDLSSVTADGLVHEVIARTRHLDILVHAAGNQVRLPTLQFSLADWNSVVDLHLTTAFILAQSAISHQIKSGRHTSLIFVGSLTSNRLGHPSTVAYNAAKAGLLGLTRTLAVEFASDGVRANTILPGFIATPRTAAIQDSPQRQALVARTPVARYGIPEDVAGLTVFLASDAARYLTGQAIRVDGGWSAA